MKQQFKVWKVFPFRIRYALFLGTILGLVLSLGLLQLKPPVLLPITSTTSSNMSGTTSPVVYNLTLPIMSIGQKLQFNFSFIAIATQNYSLSIALYGITKDNPIRIQNEILVGSLIHWNTTNASALLGRTFVFTFYLPQTGSYCLRLSANTGNAKINWILTLAVYGTNRLDTTFVWILLIIVSCLFIFMVPALFTDIITLQHYWFSHSTILNVLSSQKEHLKDPQNLLTVLKPTNPNSNPLHSSFSQLVLSFKKVFRFFVLFLSKNAALFFLFGILLMLSLTLGYSIPTFLYQQPLYKPYSDSSIFLFLSAPVLRLAVIFLVAVNLLISLDLWVDREGGSLETLLSFPISARSYYVGKLFLQLGISGIILALFFLPMLVLQILTAPIQIQPVTLLLAIVGFIMLDWVLTVVQFIFALVSRIENALLGYLLLVFGWLGGSFLLSTGGSINFFVPSALNPFVIDAPEFIIEYLFAGTGIRIHSSPIPASLVLEAVVIESILAILPVIILSLLFRYTDPLRR